MNCTNTSPNPEQPQTPVDTTSLQRVPGETPGAYNAFMAFFQLGRHRSLQGAADKSGTSIDTIKKWSSKFDWKDRIHNFTTGILRQQVEIEVEVQRKRVAAWSARMEMERKLQWIASQDLLALATKFLDNFGDEQLEKMTMNHVCRAVVLASKLGHMALAGIPQQPQFPMPRNQTKSAYIPPSRLPAPSQVTNSPQTPRIVPTTPQPNAPEAEAFDKNILVTKSAEKCHPLPTTENIATDTILPPTLNDRPLSLFNSDRSVTEDREKIISASESAEKCHPVPNREAVPTNIVWPATFDLRPSTSSESNLSNAEHHEKIISAPKSAEKCHSLPISEPSPDYYMSPASLNHQSSTSAPPACTSRRVHRSQKIFPVTESAEKCRLLPITGPSPNNYVRPQNLNRRPSTFHYPWSSRRTPRTVKKILSPGRCQKVPVGGHAQTAPNLTIDVRLSAFDFSAVGTLY